MIPGHDLFQSPPTVGLFFSVSLNNNTNNVVAKKRAAAANYQKYTYVGKVGG
jgi:hypothetical protein